MSSRGFRISGKQVVHEAFDDEVLAINLDSGTYYSLPGVSARIWACLVDGATLAAIAEALAEAYEGDRAVMNAELSRFIDRMSEEKLIVIDNSCDSAATFNFAKPSAGREPFVAPVMEIYSDMQDLLLLDPIHEVDEAGWPVIKPAASQEAKN